MKRRDFLMASAGAALAAALPLGVAAAARGALLDDPYAWVGTAYRLHDGTRLELARVEQLDCDRHTTQLRLHFRTLAGAVPREGTHGLRSAWSEETLFLQAGREGPVACVNQLRVLA